MQPTQEREAGSQMTERTGTWTTGIPQIDRLGQEEPGKLLGYGIGLLVFSCVFFSMSSSVGGGGCLTTLAILGASVETDTPTWGNMIAVGRTALQRAPHVVFEPALMIIENSTTCPCLSRSTPP